eukprot:3076397-Amphidinium_carterae.1
MRNLQQEQAMCQLEEVTLLRCCQAVKLSSLLRAVRWSFDASGARPSRRQVAALRKAGTVTHVRAEVQNS